VKNLIMKSKLNKSAAKLKVTVLGWFKSQIGGRSGT